MTRKIALIRSSEIKNIALLRSGDKKEDVFRRVCRGEISGVFDGNYTQPSVPKCHLLHHNNPYLGKKIEIV